MKILDFYAEWCGPCKSLAPIIEKVTNDMNVELEKVNIEEDDELCSKYGIRNIPTVVMIDENGNEMKRFSGSKNEQDVREFLTL